ncbi:MAG: DUF4197 domain-containing protein [Novosphingobium sp.]
MVVDDLSRMARRSFVAGASISAVAVLAGCASLPAFSLTEAIRRLLSVASHNAISRLMAPGGFWDNQLTQLALPDILGRRGGVVQSILTSDLFRSGLRRELNHIAERGARRAAPDIADAVRLIGIGNARALIDGGPSAATAFLRSAMNGRLIDTMMPELGDGLRVASDPIVGQLLSALTGVDISGVARSLAIEADDAIWGEIGREEAFIRANPQSTHDPLLIGVFGLR